jgi:O-antigen/teichoic acid export membrane protein
MQDLKEKTIRGGSARITAQAMSFVVRVASMMVLSRLLNPTDFGLLGMVTAFTGVLILFRDFGLSAASVQRTNITEEQSSTLFWINLATGALLMVIAMAAAPAVARIYHEPRLVMVTIVVATGFLANGACVQHSALLQRNMRFSALAFIDVGSWIFSTALAIGMAKSGYGYWALVAMTVSSSVSLTLGLWFTTRWIPGPPRRGVGIMSMMRFGGTMTLNGLVQYVSYNFVNVLLGRYWGAEAIGIYSRASQFIKIPTDNLNAAVGEVAFSALSRLQDDPARLRRYFIKGYSLVVAVSVPIAIACGLFADDMILVLLGPKWNEAAPIFRLLAPTTLAFAICNPLGWLLNALGLVGRGLKIALAFAPLIVTGYLLGLPYGPKGVAVAYSVVMMLWTVPAIVWAVHGTMISVRDIFVALSRPAFSIAVASAPILAMQFVHGPTLRPLPRLIVECVTLFAIYVGVLLLSAGKNSVYADILLGFLRRSPASPAAEEKALASSV